MEFYDAFLELKDHGCNVPEEHMLRSYAAPIAPATTDETVTNETDAQPATPVLSSRQKRQRTIDQKHTAYMDSLQKSDKRGDEIVEILRDLTTVFGDYVRGLRSSPHSLDVPRVANNPMSQTDYDDSEYIL